MMLRKVMLMLLLASGIVMSGVSAMEVLKKKFVTSNEAIISFDFDDNGNFNRRENKDKESFFNAIRQ